MVAEQLGKPVAPGPLYAVSVVLAALADCADLQSHAATIGSLVSGETGASWAVSEPGRGWAPLDPSLTATQTDAGFRLDGTKDRVAPDAQTARLPLGARSGPDASQIRQLTARYGTA